MLYNIIINNAASYGDKNQRLADLNIINFVFGDNGSGKSTIARFLENDQHPDFKDCKLEWDAYGPTKTLIYNRQFVDDTLREKVKGVFTFGEKAGVKQDELVKLISERDKEEEKRSKLRVALASKTDELTNENTRFTDKCWFLKQKHEIHFNAAFEGFKRKELFKNKCLESIESVATESLDELQIQAKIFFNEQPSKIDLLPVFENNDLGAIESNEILRIKILGKDDVPISDLINKLGNSDWVRQGTNYLADRICPFCQQPVSDSLKKDLEDYFDESYTTKMNELDSASARYSSYASSLLRHYESLAQHENQFFSFETIRGHIDTVKAIYGKNLELISKKYREPSLTITIEPLEAKINDISKLIDKSNALIAAFNTKLDNFAVEKAKLISSVWRYLGSEAKSFFGDHKQISTPIQSAVDGMNERLRVLGIGIESLTQKIMSLGRELTSTAPSKDGINSILNSFGFDNFRLEDAEEGYYRIVRADGTFAQETLSEGERTFITFLYFYQLIQGSTSKDGVSTPRIVVFDDPVSSLDSKVLFIVSTLIRGLYCSDTLARLNIIQLLILTHNVYFHKEVSFTGGLKNIGSSPLNESNFSYWIVRKQNGVSNIVAFSKNPIKTNYQLLWQEVKRCEENPEANINVCNTLRRILENYFRVLGGIDLTELTEEFEGTEKLVFRSLTSWIHDGSHCMYDGIDIGFGQDLADNYLPVFKKIFEKKHHLSHYDMMMSSCE